ncbi:MAG TPA: protein translocase subunit SecF [Marmoricola sp.]|nr:protein translocase subunit SecF [Marmoricola sp.]
MGRFSRLGNDLYEGRTSIDFVGKRWIWYSFSLLMIVLAVSGLWFRGLNLGIEFKGGDQYTVSLPSAQVNQQNADLLREAIAATAIPAADNPVVTTSGNHAILVTTESLSDQETQQVTDVIAKKLHVDAKTKISSEEIGPSWGSQVAKRAATGLVVFIVLVILAMWAYFREWKMSVAAVIALAHDIVITVGFYALSGFEVTPATVTGFLTILGYSLYDTVVVFDKVRENTKNLRQARKNYAQLANLAVNQTLVRSINTSIVALLPVAALLYAGAIVLGSGDMKDLALALFVGMIAGAYSSIFIATPLLAQMKAREKEISEQAARAKARARRDADRYANVPSFTEDMPIMDPDAPARPSDTGTAGEDETAGVAAVRVPRSENRPEATGSGRTLPASKAPVRESGAAKRNQPSRQPRSKRGK